MYAYIAAKNEERKFSHRDSTTGRSKDVCIRKAGKTRSRKS